MGSPGFRTYSIVTATLLVALGERPLGIIRAVKGPLFRFNMSAALTADRLRDTRALVESYAAELARLPLEEAEHRPMAAPVATPGPLRRVVATEVRQ